MARNGCRETEADQVFIEESGLHCVRQGATEKSGAGRISGLALECMCLLAREEGEMLQTWSSVLHASKLGGPVQDCYRKR